jgi:hypothetical protein
MARVRYQRPGPRYRAEFLFQSDEIHVLPRKGRS